MSLQPSPSVQAVIAKHNRAFWEGFRKCRCAGHLDAVAELIDAALASPVVSSEWRAIAEENMKALPIDALLAHIRAEVVRAEAKHAPMNSAHEGYAVILEEVDELWDEVKKQSDARSPENMEKESIQIAAMACRFVLNVLWACRAEAAGPKAEDV